LMRNSRAFPHGQGWFTNVLAYTDISKQKYIVLFS
jgi:hypothetical protein